MGGAGKEFGVGDLIEFAHDNLLSLNYEGGGTNRLCNNPKLDLRRLLRRYLPTDPWLLYRVCGPDGRTGELQEGSRRLSLRTNCPCTHENVVLDRIQNFYEILLRLDLDVAKNIEQFTSLFNVQTWNFTKIFLSRLSNYRGLLSLTSSGRRGFCSPKRRSLQSLILLWSGRLSSDSLAIPSIV